MKNNPYLLIFFLIATALYASDGQFLNIAVNPRAIGLAGAYSAVADDPGAAYWNPARLNEVRGTEFSFMHQKWMFETDFEFLSAVGQLPWGVGGFSISYLHMPDIGVFDTTGASTGSASVYDMAVAASFASQPLGIPFGVNIKYIHKVLDELSANAIAADLGLSYDIDFLKIYRSGYPNLTFAFALKNFGTKLDYGGFTASLPLSLALGMKYIVVSLKNHKYFISADENYYIEDAIHVAAFGMEYSYLRKYSLRAGMQVKNSQILPMAGAGLYYDISTFNISVDAAYFKFNGENVYCFSIGFRNAFDRNQKVTPEVLEKAAVSKSDTPRTEKMKVGIINFKNLGHQQAYEFLSETIPENVKTTLSKNTNLIIIETEKVNAALAGLKTESNQELDYNALFLKLGVDQLIMGSFLDLNDNITVNMKIVNVKDNSVVWGKSLAGYSGKTLFSLIDKISLEMNDFYKKK